MATFDAAIDYVLDNEGGLVDNPNDPGGLTNFGISTKYHPEFTADQIRQLNRVGAANIYRSKYWLPIYYRIGSQMIATKLLDTAVSMGPHTAHCFLQNALSIPPDGVFGEQTLAAINANEPHKVLQGFITEVVIYRISRVMLNQKLEGFLRGWIARACRWPV